MKNWKRKIMILRFKLFLYRRNTWEHYKIAFKGSQFLAENDTLHNYLYRTAPGNFIDFAFETNHYWEAVHTLWVQNLYLNTMKRFLKKLLWILLIGIIGGFLITAIIITFRILIG
jgi:hypothetical protein